MGEEEFDSEQVLSRLNAAEAKVQEIERLQEVEYLMNPNTIGG